MKTAKVNYNNPELKINSEVELPINGEGVIYSCWKAGKYYETQRHGMLSGCNGSVPTIDLKQKFVIDVGANIGNHSIFFAAVMGAGVYAIEPEPENFKHLETNTEQFGQIVTINAAAGAKDGKIKMTGQGMVAKPGKEGIEVDVIKIDSLKIDLVSLIKIDVEGFEYEVLKGARNTIKKHKPILFIEIGTDEKSNGEQLAKISGYLEKLGYGLYKCPQCGGKGKTFVFNQTPTYRFDPK